MNCSSVSSPAPDIFRLVCTVHKKSGVSTSGGPVPTYVKDGIIFFSNIRDFRTACKYYDTYTKANMPRGHALPSSQERRRSKRLNNFREMVHDLDVNTRTKLINKAFAFSQDSLHNRYLAATYKPKNPQTYERGWRLTSSDIGGKHNKLLPIEVGLNKSQEKKKTVDPYLHKGSLPKPKVPFGDALSQRTMSDGEVYKKFIIDCTKPQGYKQNLEAKPARIDYKTLNRAIELTYTQQKKVGYHFKEMGYNEILRSKDFRKIKDHSTGFTAPGFRNKEEAARNLGFKDFYNKFASDPTAKATYQLFMKNEAIKLSKLLERGPRIIVASSLEHEMLSRKVLQNYIHSVERHRHDCMIKIGIRNTEWSDLYEYHNKGPQTLFYCADFSMQDKRMPTQIMHASKEIKLRLAKEQGMDQHFIRDLRHTLDSAIEKNIVFPNGQIIQLYELFPTGTFNTANGNSDNHQLLWNYTLLKAGLTEEEISKITRSHYGDDVILSDRGRLSGLKDTVQRIALDLGMPMTFDAWGAPAFRSNGDPNPEVTFLRRSFDTYGGEIIAKYESDRILAKWLCPATNIKDPGQSVDRTFSFALLCGGNERLFNTIMSSARETASKYGVERDYLNLSYNSMIHTWYIGDQNPEYRLPAEAEKHLQFKLDDPLNDESNV